MAPQPVEWQQKACAEAVEPLGLPHVTYTQEPLTGTRDRREAWLTALLADEVAVVASLEVLVRKPPDGTRRIVDWNNAISLACQRAHHMVEASTGITSLDRKQWAARLNAVANKIANGRVLTRARARRMAKLSRERRPPGIVATWLDASFAKRREAAQKRWHGARTRREAWDALTDAERDELGSISTAMRVLEADRPWQPVTARKRTKR